ncbi:hypothetical protein [Paraburkholderia sp.]|uniref:hypothetical protein n=1 Tax=Paraburkholderia sp. TaxID=1926495 RepID=UPI00262E72A0|nr:hypothetical protein [Paraburkholderia sp.]
MPLAPRHLFDIFNLCGTLIPIVEHRGEKYGLVVYAVDNIVTVVTVVTIDVPAGFQSRPC